MAAPPRRRLSLRPLLLHLLPLQQPNTAAAKHTQCAGGRVGPVRPHRKRFRRRRAAAGVLERDQLVAAAAGEEGGGGCAGGVGGHGAE